MHPAICYRLAQARVADLGHDARRGAWACAVRRARPEQCEQSEPRLHGLSCGVPPVPGACSS